MMTIKVQTKCRLQFDYFHELITTQEIVRCACRGYGDGMQCSAPFFILTFVRPHVWFCYRTSTCAQFWKRRVESESGTRCPVCQKVDMFGYLRGVRRQRCSRAEDNGQEDRRWQVLDYQRNVSINPESSIKAHIPFSKKWITNGT